MVLGPSPHRRPEGEEEARGQVRPGTVANAEQRSGGVANGGCAARDEGEEEVFHRAEKQAATGQVEEGIGEDVAAARGAEDRVSHGLEILTV